MGSDSRAVDELRERVEAIAGEAGARRLGMAYHDFATEAGGDHNGDEWFHAASTIKVPLLVGVFAAAEEGDPELDARVHVRNRFFSVADGKPFRVEPGRDANSEVHGYIGKTMKVRDLARQMIVTSSNLGTNLLVDAIGLDRLRSTLAELGVKGIELRRGVEDEAAYEEGINNEVTANGLVSVLRLLEEGRAVSAASGEQMLDILYAQEFRAGIPAGVPGDARVANKTGEISTVAHDAGLVYPEGRKPYAVAILTEWEPDTNSGRRDTIARISRAVYDHLAGGDR